MKIDHVRFFVEDAKVFRDWLVRQLGFEAIASGIWQQSHLEVVNSGDIYFVLCSPRSSTSPVAAFLQRHPAGVADVVLSVADLDKAIARATRRARLLVPIQSEILPHGQLRWATLAAWGSLSHTFVERRGTTSLLPLAETTSETIPVFLRSPGAAASPPLLGKRSLPLFTQIDHAVLNVPQGEMERVAAWYAEVLGLEGDQSFQIQTDHSGLCSRVMRHPSGSIQIPINEPASPNSQIQEFLEWNRGAGIQHIALATDDLLGAIAHLRDRGLPLIDVPSHYYSGLQSTAPFPIDLLSDLEAQQVLAEWQCDRPALLLQTFTQPIFDQPTFFFELIQRQFEQWGEPLQQAQGFGEGNFRALYEAIEQAQIKRGSLVPATGGNC